MLPSLALEPPKGEYWIHEIKFDGYRTVLVVENSSVQAFTRNRLDWSDRYRPIVEAAGKLRGKSAVIDGKIVVLDDTGRSRLQFSEAIAGSGPDVFASAERMGLEGIVSKRLGSHYRSGRVDTWRKVKCWTESTLVLIGTELDKRSGALVALLARQSKEGLSYAGGAFFALKGPQRGSLRERLARLTIDRAPISALRKRGALWLKPELVVGVRHLRGAGALRHATVQDLRDA